MSGVAQALAAVLAEGDFTDVFTTPPSAHKCAEPIVVREGEFQKGARTRSEERGLVEATVLVVRESPEAAGHDAMAADTCLRRARWEAHAGAGPYRVLGLTTTVPHYRGRDGSGRHVWQLGVTVAVSRPL